MKKRGFGLVFLPLLAVPAILVVPAVSQPYDNSPAGDIIIPECIWAPATGGGTWVTELQITDMTGGSVVIAGFFYGTGSRVVNLWTSPGQYRSVKYTNILATLQSMDPSFTYYGKVGTLWLSNGDAAPIKFIQAQARTVNGDYGKTYPGLRRADSNTANLNRRMMVPNLTQNAAYRTFVGFFNDTMGGYSMTLEFRIFNQNGAVVGNIFTKTFTPWQFASFNPFVEAGVGTGTYDNCWLWINPTASGNSGANTHGLFCFGSSANNYTNDTAALLAVQFQ